MVSTWDILSKIYKKEFGVPKKVFTVMCTRAILLLCVSGMSNESIAEFLKIDENMVKKHVKDALNFDGWSMDLCYNPLYYSKYFPKELTEEEKNLCAKYKKLFDKIEPYYK